MNDGMDFSINSIKGYVLEKKQGLVDRIKETKRVLKITEKPDREEFSMSAKVTGAGMVIIGAIGFLFYLGSNLLPQLLG
ncbi:MAG: protein translocase SEC61 complex subunit gamma [Candidatus Nanosalina sp.]